MVFPSNILLRSTIVKVLSDNKGIMTTSEINNRVIEELKLSKEVLELESDDGCGTKIDYQLRLMRTYLKKRGIIQNPKKGYWMISK